jgi:glycosyltransferase involved in cell wall biosynthesis
MRVGIVAEVFWPKIDGVVNRTLNLIRQLVHAGDDLLVICPRAVGEIEYPVAVPLVDVPSFSFPLYPEYRIGLPSRRLAGIVKDFAPDVLHYINPFAFGFRCHDLLRRTGTPTVFSFHTLYGEFVKQYKELKALSNVLWWLTREYHNRADINLTVSGIMRDELVRRGFRRVEVWPPAVDSELFHPSRKNAAMRARLTGDRPTRRLLLTVSRLAPEKNVGFLVDLIKEFPDACLAVVGDGPQRAELERHFDGTDTRFLGYLKGEELAAAYASADVFVYASETETMGNVVLEAMACGCAVVVPRAGGIPNLLCHGTSGFLYQPRGPPDAVQATRTLLEDESLRSRFGLAARQAIEERNWEQSVHRVRQIYAEAIQEGRPPAGRSRASSRPWTWQQRVAQGTTLALVSAFRSLARAKGRLMPPSSSGRTPNSSRPAAPHKSIARRTKRTLLHTSL